MMKPDSEWLERGTEEFNTLLRNYPNWRCRAALKWAEKIAAISL
jgi:hypothetical protein